MSRRPIGKPQTHLLLWICGAVVLAAAALLILPGATAQCASGPPPNDCFVNAITIPSSPYTTTAQSTFGATTEPAEPQPCGLIGATIWYSWTPTYSGTGQIDTYGSGWDTVVAAYTGTSVTGLSNVACNDDNPPLESMFTFTCVAGTTYMIQAGGYNGGTGNMIVNVSGCNGFPTCSPTTQTIPPGPASFTAGGAGPYTWSAPGGSPSTGSGPAFTASFLTTGSYTVTVTNAQGSANCMVNVVVPGCGYTVTNPITYDWSGIAATGTPASPFGAGADDGYEMQPLAGGSSTPFNFVLCGVSYNSVYLSSNGYLCFDIANWCAMYPGQSLPNPGVPLSAIFAYWTDLYPPSCGSGSCVKFETQGVSPNRVFIYEMVDVPIYSGYYPGETFEIKLFEGTNCFQVHYQSVQDSSGYQSVAAGYQDATGTAGYEYVPVSSPGFTRATTAWQACPVPPFRANPESFTFNEDQPAQSFNVTGNDVNSVAGGFSIISRTTPALGTLTGPVGGVFTYQPAPDQTGADSFNYTIENANGQTSTTTVSLTINPVNDIPTFTATTPPIFTSPSAGTYLANWARNVAPGPLSATDEAGQELTFDLVSNSNPGLFASAPTVFRTGSLTATYPVSPPTSGSFAALRFEPSGNSGHATVCFILRDDGGTASVTTVGLTPPRTDTGVDTAAAPQCVEIDENGAPVAYFTVDSTQAQPGQSLSFNSCPGVIPACSYDLDGTIQSYRWDFGDGAGSSQQLVAHGYATPGVYVVRLTVTDNSGLTGVMTRTIRVDLPGQAPVRTDGNSDPFPPVADAGADLDVSEGTNVRIVGSQHGGNERATFLWTQVGGPTVELRNATSETLSFVAPRVTDGRPLVLMFALRISQGTLTGAPDYVTVTVHPRNTPPVADAGGTITVDADAVVTLDGSRTADAQHDALTFHWEQVQGAPVVITDADKPKATFTAPHDATMLKFRLRVTDASTSSEDNLLVYVQTAEANPTGVHLSYDITAVADGADVQFVAVGATDAVWEFGDGSSASGATIRHHYAPGVYDARMQTGGSTYVQHLDVQAPKSREASARAEASVPLWVGIAAVWVALAGGAVYVVLRKK